MKIEADRRTADAKRILENLDDEILGGSGCQRRVETHDDSAIELSRPQQAQLVAFIAELEQRVLRPQEKSRMWRERQGRRLAAKRPGARQRCANDGAMTPMNAVEVADRHHRAGQRAAVGALRAAARDVELFRG